MQLVLPTIEHRGMWYDIVEEFNTAGEKIVPYALTYRQDSFEVFLKNTEENRSGINLGSHVPSTTYFLIEDNQAEIIGAVNIRHWLNEDLLFNGGHIGYGIRPTQRKKGYATKILSLALIKCKEMELSQVLVTCNIDNKGSARTIINNGGVLENEVTESNGTVVQRYWIKLI